MSSVDIERARYLQHEAKLAQQQSHQGNTTSSCSRVYALAARSFSAAYASYPLATAVSAESVLAKAIMFETEAKYQAADEVVLTALQASSGFLGTKTEVWNSYVKPLILALFSNWDQRLKSETGFLFQQNGGAWSRSMLLNT